MAKSGNTEREKNTIRVATKGYRSPIKNAALVESDLSAALVGLGSVFDITGSLPRRGLGKIVAVSPMQALEADRRRLAMDGLKVMKTINVGLGVRGHKVVQPTRKFPGATTVSVNGKVVKVIDGINAPAHEIADIKRYLNPNSATNSKK